MAVLDKSDDSVKGGSLDGDNEGKKQIFIKFQTSQIFFSF